MSESMSCSIASYTRQGGIGMRKGSCTAFLILDATNQVGLSVALACFLFVPNSFPVGHFNPDAFNAFVGNSNTSGNARSGMYSPWSTTTRSSSVVACVSYSSSAAP